MDKMPQQREYDPQTVCIQSANAPAIMSKIAASIANMYVKCR